MYKLIEVSKEEIESIRKMCPRLTTVTKIDILEMAIKVYSISDNIFASDERDNFRTLDRSNLHSDKCIYARFEKISKEEEDEHIRKLNAFVSCQSGIRTHKQSLLNACIQQLYVLENKLYREDGIYGFREYC